MQSTSNTARFFTRPTPLPAHENILAHSRIPSASIRLAHAALGSSRTPTPSLTIRRRQNLHLTPSSSQFPVTFAKMTSNLPNIRSDNPISDQWEIDRAGEVFLHEWTIISLGKLRDYVEHPLDRASPSIDEWGEDETIPSVLRRGRVSGGGWFKLDLAHTAAPSPYEPLPDPKPEDPMTLSLFIAAIALDFGDLDTVYSANIFIGIAPAQRRRTGNRNVETRWVWHTNVKYDFTPHADVWETRLPKLSDLLADHEFAVTDAMTICIRISTPTPECPEFTLPGQVTAPRYIVEGFRGLIDSNTGDVRILCLEHAVGPLTPEGELDQDRDVNMGERFSGEGKPQLVSRKRILYAHSSILKAASEYFSALLTGDFEEAERARRGDDKRFTITVDDAGFPAVFWMLNFLYTNEIVFAETEDVRALMKVLQIDRQESTRYLVSSDVYRFGVGEWEYRHLRNAGEDNDMDDMDGFETRTVMSVSSTNTRISVSSDSLAGKGSQTVGRTRSIGAPTSLGETSKSPRRSIPTVVRSPRAPASSSSIRPAASSSKSTASSTPISSPQPMANANPTSPSSTQKSKYSTSGLTTEPDPHPHPCGRPSPASPLSIYMLSHRYQLDLLERLAMDQIASNMTPENCMPMFLATFQYEDLHRNILDYVMDRWVTIRDCDEFLRCIQEVSAGIWGDTGGLALHGLFRRLGPYYDIYDNTA